MNKRIISFICAGLIAISCVSSLCFYDYFSTDGITPNAIYWIFYFFQISILLGQAGMGIYTINALLRQKKEAVSFLQKGTPFKKGFKQVLEHLIYFFQSSLNILRRFNLKNPHTDTFGRISTPHGIIN